MFPLCKLRQKSRYDNMNNPFQGGEQEQINIDKLAEEMAQTIRKIKQNAELSVQDRNEISDNSVSSFPQAGKNQKSQYSFGSMKRSNPVKIFPVARKRICTASQNEANLGDDSQFIDSISNKKITQYLNVKHKVIVQVTKIDKDKALVSSEDEENKQAVFDNPKIKKKQEIIAKQKKKAEEIQNQVAKCKQKSETKIREQTVQMQNQKSILMEFMKKRYDTKIFNQRLEQITKKSKIPEKMVNLLLEDIKTRSEYLKNQKNNIKKGSGRSKTGNEQYSLLQIFSEDRQPYFNAWKKRFDSEKSLLQKQAIKFSSYDHIQLNEQKYYPLPDMVIDENEERILLFQQTYFPLYLRSNPESMHTSFDFQIRALNLKKLSSQNLRWLIYPKMMKIQKRMKMNSYINQIHRESLRLNEDGHGSLFINNTNCASFSTISQEYIVMGRAVWEQDSPTITLRHLLKRYECFHQNIAKFIGKSILRAHQKIKREIGIEAIILPDNVIFNERYELRIDNWVQNETFRFEQYSQLLKLDSNYLYLPPEHKTLLYNEDRTSQNMAVWSTGVMLYQMIYGKKPLNYLFTITDHQQFYMMWQIQFPPKPPVPESFKQLIKMCLSKPGSRICLEKALKHPFFELKK